MIELAILGLLKDHPMHGYQLSRELAEQLGGLWKVSYGSLYPTLRRLERDRAVEPTTGTGSTGGGRRKTVYRITEDGERLFLGSWKSPRRTAPPRTPASGCASPSSDTSPRRPASV